MPSNGMIMTDYTIQSTMKMLVSLLVIYICNNCKSYLIYRVKCTGWIALNEVRRDLSTKTGTVDCMSLNTAESNSWLLSTEKETK